ncbi:MAG TPA: hypothetical protein VLC93_11490, partial [Myxococcota bacterium]|nr:hypothetical protein [Myxococcota bacterium]
PPTHPGDPKFWPEFEQVVDLQLARRRGSLARDVVELPQLFANYTMEQAAKAVGDDYPPDFPTALSKQFYAEGARVDTNLIPAYSTRDFVNGILTVHAIIGWAVRAVSPSAFAAKWEVGRRRPEEIAWDIHTGKLDASPRIKRKIAALGMERAEDFTAYQEGCPRHPAWPAMHSAASISSTLLAVLMDLTPAQVEEARRLDFAVSTFRSVAGVHYYGDNAAGLAIGQAVLEKLLPEQIASYVPDADKDRVRAAVKKKLERYHYDWYEHTRKNGGPI